MVANHMRDVLLAFLLGTLVPMVYEYVKKIFRDWRDHKYLVLYTAATLVGVPVSALLGGTLIASLALALGNACVLLLFSQRDKEEE
jgi:hypothetical protein